MAANRPYVLALVKPNWKIRAYKVLENATNRKAGLFRHYGYAMALAEKEETSSPLTCLTP